MLLALVGQAGLLNDVNILDPLWWTQVLSVIYSAPAVILRIMAAKGMVMAMTMRKYHPRTRTKIPSSIRTTRPATENPCIRELRPGSNWR